MAKRSAKSSNSRYKMYSKRKKAAYRKLSKYSSAKRTLNKKKKKGFLGKKGGRKLILIFLAVGGFLTVAGVIGVFAVLAKYTADLPNPAEPFEKGQALSSKIYDRNGELLYTIYGEENREVVKIEDISPYMKWAILAAEDIDFYNRKTSVDIPSLARAFYRNITGGGGGLQGASTITQQMLKNTVLSTERTYERKIKEIILTMQVEKRYSKDEILQLYLNEVAFGGNNYGIKAAANAYFAKDPSELTLAESALLAALPQAPSYYSPVFGGNPEAAESRQLYVLDQMLKYKDKTGVTEEEIEAAKNEELVYQTGRIDIKAPHFVFYVKQLLEEEFGFTTKEIEQGGLEIYTTLDYTMQKYGEEEISAKNDLLVRYNAHNASLVTINPNTGEILAMVGSKDYWGSEEGGVFDGKVNVATALRQPGSSVKPYTYVTAFDKGLLFPSTMLPDVPIEFPDYEPKNWDNKFYGPMNVRTALQLSRNIPAVKTLDLVGIDAFIETAEKFGITTFTNRADYGLSLTLGAGDVKLLEHTAAYGVFATGGIKHPNTAILKIVKPGGQIVHEYKAGGGTRVFDEKPIYLLNTVMGRSNCSVDYVHRLQCISGFDTAGKTGTSNENRNLWFIGYTPDLVTGIWAGNNDNSVTTYGSYGSLVALPIWHDYMARVLPTTQANSFQRPAGIVTRNVCKATGLLPAEGCPEIAQEYFIDGKFPGDEKMIQKIEVCKDQGLLATEGDKLSGNAEEKVVLRYREAKDSWQVWLDKWMDDPSRADQYRIPTEYCEGYRNPSGQEEPWAIFNSPENNSTVEVGTLKIDVSPVSPDTITKVELYFDEKLIKTLTSVPYEYSYTIPEDTESGTHKVSANVFDSAGKKGTSFVNIVVSNPAEPSETVVTTVTAPPELKAKYSGDVKEVAGVFFYYEKNSVNTLIGQGASTGKAGEYSVEWEGVAKPYRVFAVVKFKDVFKEDLQSEKVLVK